MFCMDVAVFYKDFKGLFYDISPVIYMVNYIPFNLVIDYYKKKKKKHSC